MKTIFKFKKFPKTNKELYIAMMEMKSIIDTILEDKGLDDSHDLAYASRHIDNCLNAIEEQDSRVPKSANKWINNEK